MIPSMTLCLFRQRPSTEDARIGWTSLQSFCRLQKDNAETLLFSRVLRMIAYLMEVAARTCLRDHPLTGVHHQQHQSEHRHYHLETTLQEETRNPQEINSRLRKLRPRDQYCSPKSDGRLRAFVGTRSSIPPKRQASTCTDWYEAILSRRRLRWNGGPDEETAGWAPLVLLTLGNLPTAYYQR
jgi:hypothetical protein